MLCHMMGLTVVCIFTETPGMESVFPVTGDTHLDSWAFRGSREKKVVALGKGISFSSEREKNALEITVFSIL